MAGNLSEPGMHNFNLLDGRDPNYRRAMMKNNLMLPSEVNTYAPGSPKPMTMRDKDQEYYTNKAVDGTHLYQDFSGMSVSSGYVDSFKADLSTGNNVEEDLKDAQIKLLTRNVTIMQAKLHQAEGMKEKFETEMAYKDHAHDDELRRAQEQILNLNQNKENLMIIFNQSSEENTQLKLKLQQKELASHKELADNRRLIEEIKKLNLENRSLKETIKNLTSECSSLRESIMASGHNSHSTSGSNTLHSTQACSKELANLHQVVDSLKSTVLQQRNFLMKLKMSQTSSASTSVTSVRKILGAKEPVMSGANTSFQPLPRVRQGEEGAAPLFHKPRVLSVSSEHLPSSGTSDSTNDLPFGKYVPTQHSGSSAALTLPVKTPSICRPDSMMPVARFGVDVNAIGCALPYNNSRGYAINEEEELHECNSSSLAQNGNDQLYMNISEWHPGNNPPKLPRSGISKATSPKTVPSPLENLKFPDRSRQEEHTWNHSQSEIFYPRSPTTNLPTRSKSERFGYNPRVQGQLPPQCNLQSQSQQSPLRRPSTEPLYYRQEGQAEQHWHGSFPQPPVVHVLPSMLSNQTSGQPQAQSSHYHHQQGLSVSSPPSTVRGMAKSAVPFTAPTVMSSPKSRYSPENSVYDNVDPLPLHSAQNKLSSDRLCPVCTHDFSSVTMDEFQSHVLECFDNENAPDTMVAENSGPQYACPMCNRYFGAGVSQTEFEKHVHSHFGENPGENFEILQS